MENLAKYLGVSPASSTEMIQRLAKNGFVDYVPYKGAILTEKRIRTRNDDEEETSISRGSSYCATIRGRCARDCMSSGACI